MVVRPVARKVDDTVSALETDKVPPILEEALEIKPFIVKPVATVAVATPLKKTELEVFRLPVLKKLPETWRAAPIELEALLINHPCRVARPVARKVLDTVVAPEIETVPPKELDELLTIKPLFRVARPVVRKVDDTVVAPDTDKVPPILDEE